jgi:hypothetical protein
LASLTFSDSRIVRTLIAVLLTGLACALDATALVWPIGYALATPAGNQSRLAAVAMLAAGAAGVLVSWFAGWPSFTTYRFYQVVYTVHQDLIVLLPVLVIGFAGYAGQCECSQATRAARGATPWLSGWSALAVAALFVALVGGPVHVRICVLPFWWWLPAGLAELSALLKEGEKSAARARGVGLLSCVLLACLLLTSWRHWLDGPLMGLCLLTQGP